MEKTHTLESGDDLFHTNQSATTCSKIVIRRKRGTCLANELPGDAVRLDLNSQTCYHQRSSPSPKPKPKPKPNAPAQMAKSWLGKRVRTMTKDLSVTVPFSPAIVLAPSSRTGDLVAEHHPYFVSALYFFFFFFFSPSLRLFKGQGTKTYSRRGHNQRRRYRGQERQRRWTWAHERGWWRMPGLEGG